MAPCYSKATLSNLCYIRRLIQKPEVSTASQRIPEGFSQTENSTDDQVGGAAMEQPRPLSTGSRESREHMRLLFKALRSFIPDKISAKYCNLFPLLRKCIEAYCELYFIYGMDFNMPLTKLLKPWETMLWDIERCLDQGGTWIDYFKWKNAAFFSAWNDQELPVLKYHLARPNPRILVGGVYYKYLGVLRRSGHMKSFSLSILMSKKGMPRPTKEQVDLAAVKAAKILATPKEETSFNWIPSFQPYDLPISSTPIRFGRTFIERELRRTMREFTRSTDPFSLDTLTKPVAPSASANYINSREGYGSYPSVCSRLASHPITPKISVCEVDMLTRIEGFGMDQVISELDHHCESRIGVKVDLEGFKTEYRRFYWQCFFDAIFEQPTVKTVGLSEALKIRVISKGPPLHYFVLKPVQQFLWNGLQTFGTFDLTGQPISEQWMNRKFAHLDDTLRMHSGDYSDATNELHSWVSETLIHELVDQWEGQVGFSLDHLRQLMLESMIDHLIEIDGHPFEQKRGQLMGSILSFVFLCLANVTLIRMAYELSHGTRCNIRDLPTTINGDDCLTFYSSSTFPEFWEGLGSVMGLTKSVGKSYDSQEFCSINSRFFVREKSRFKHIPFVNLGLLKCFKRSSTAEENPEKDPIEFQDLYQELIDLSPRWCLKTVEDYFLYLHSSSMKQYPTCWSLPHWLGGLGVGTPTHNDLFLAAQLRMFLGREDPFTVSSNSEWLTHQKILELCRKTHPLFTDAPFQNMEGEETYGQSYLALFYGILGSNGYKALVSTKRDVFSRSKKEMIFRFQRFLRDRDSFCPSRAMFPHELRWRPVRQQTPLFAKE